MGLTHGGVLFLTGLLRGGTHTNHRPPMLCWLLLGLWIIFCVGHQVSVGWGSKETTPNRRDGGEPAPRTITPILDHVDPCGILLEGGSWSDHSPSSEWKEKESVVDPPSVPSDPVQITSTFFTRSTGFSLCLAGVTGARVVLGPPLAPRYVW